MDYPEDFAFKDDDEVFKFQRILGEGAFGYGLLYGNSNKQVAVKILKPNTKANLNKEAYLFSKFKNADPPMQHVPLYYGEKYHKNGQSYIIMECIPYSVEEYICMPQF
jgi:serine/threonine protein kinase